MDNLHVVHHRLFYAIVCAILLLGLSTRQADAQNVVSLLKSGKVVKQQPMGQLLASQGKKQEFENEVFLVTLDNGLQAVFKPGYRECAYAEVAAYQASVRLGFPYIPDTIIRTIGGKKGSLQLFMETSIDPLAPGVYEQALKEVGSLSLRRD